MSRVADRAYKQVRQSILDGHYSPGEHLVEADLASSLEASRTPVREALGRLVAEGLVEVLPHKGARVARWSVEDLEETYELRAELEAFAARRAATRLTREHLERLSQLCGSIENAVGEGLLDDVASFNSEFHELIRQGAESPRVVAMLNAVVQLPMVLTTFHRYSKNDLLRSNGHHRELVDALEASEPEWAAAVMRSHVLAAKSVLVRSMSSAKDPA